MSLLDWWRKRKEMQRREAESMAQMRRDDESGVPVPAETYLSQTRD